MIHSKSKRIVREEKIEDILYKDAMRRQEKKKRTNEKMKRKIKTQVKKNFSAHSEQAFAHKFIKEYETIVSNIFFGRK
jgi:hypothetical protein